jgi:GntR family galactonate operon transcriptional repressor
MTIAKARPLARRSLHDRIVEELGRRIVAGTYGPDGPLPTEPQLAADLGVSRNALREAIKVLASKGMVEVRTKTGMRVRPPSDWSLLDRDVLDWHSLSDIRLNRSFDLVEFRLIVEPRASFLAARRATADDVATILAACADLEACIGHPDLVPGRDIAFHRSIHHASHNTILDHLGSLSASLMRVQVSMTTQEPGSFEAGLPLHREVAEAIRDRDAVHAEEASRRLVLMPYADLRGRLGLAADSGLD